MANIVNPRKLFQFSIYAPGLSPFLAQEVTIPEESIDVDEHGDTNFNVKTGGKKKIGKLIIQKIMLATLPELWVYNWMNEVQSTSFGGGLLPSIYYKNLTIDEYSVDGITILNTWTLIECWPSNRAAIDLKRAETGNTIERCEFEVNEVVKQ